MARRRLLAGILLAAGSYGGSLLYRRRAASRSPRVEVWYGDGSTVSLPSGSAAAERLLGLAADLLGAAR